MVNLKELESRIQRLIPLTGALGLQLEAFDGNELIVSAPLETNRNHQATAFGGSLYCVGVMAVWARLQLWLDQNKMAGSIVIQSGAMDYDEPVTDDFQGVATLPDKTTMDRAEAMLRRHGKARLSLASDIIQEGQPRGRFIGRFVILQG
ncbi:YiiD C-terminal domain-containing protein [Hydrocarboniclastica marina]|uniref:Thioesterase n=1 Tax=Hydrocarboniclastica marina TaxID=2259620 RepID=A0A4P7XGS7_9ALTE|nr:YiiD C-terminal domain-containing protein [Hydrocarboniclastica marina]MAL98396.1 thioesterase [Alteromonadaceae bacterium]QCF25843.1 thioesterase [Hydrocarboniclastica marina]|tara:strand:+ start:4753 stop:5199 length:447 start_codon:yes stop_codon:yes gene_type:complete